MTLEKNLLDAGAQCVAGHLVLNNTVMGSYVDGNFLVSEHGLKFAETTPTAAKPAKKTKAPKNVEHADDSAIEISGAADLLYE